MTTIIKSSTSSLDSTTAESLLIELTTLIRVKEDDTTSNPNGRKLIQLTYNLNNSIANASFSLPIIQEINSTGQIVTTAGEYLILPSFVHSGDGTFKATQITQLFYELLTFLQITERNTNKNPNTANNISGSLDTDENSFTGTFQLPVTISFNNGNPVIIAKEYLL